MRIRSSGRVLLPDRSRAQPRVAVPLVSLTRLQRPINYAKLFWKRTAAFVQPTATRGSASAISGNCRAASADGERHAHDLPCALWNETRHGGDADRHIHGHREPCARIWRAMSQTWLVMSGM
jgi:hypothetical protein